MKQIAQNYRSGDLEVVDVPVPSCKPGGVLVRTLFSLISTGTELMKVREARLSLLGKARARPDQVRKLLDAVAQQGAVATYQKAVQRLDSWTALGYSLCGVVVEVGAGGDEFAVGDLVAAAGNEFALHAELNWVPTNLCVPVPDGVAPEHAAFATVGAIAMQGVRRAETALGETAVVIGLGLIGQLTVRLLVASGVHVVGLDPVRARCRDAETAGALLCAAPDEDGVAAVQEALARRTGGIGADCVLLAAGGDSNAPVRTAARLVRDRGRVVDIGKTRLDLPWNAYYDKELDVRFSRSYGPGRYDDSYELDGVDYPAGYVRWTERRNLACFLDLLADGAVDLASLAPAVHPVEEAADVYARIRSGELDGVGFLLSYPTGGQLDLRRSRTLPTADARAGAGPVTGVTTPRRTSVPARERVRLGFVGAGNYATSMLLPHLTRSAGVDLVSVATTTALSGYNAREKFGFGTITTDVDVVLDDGSLDAVVVVTRHSSHADLVRRALRRGLAVFVEKPLAITDEDVDRIVETVAQTGNDRLLVGFNRRFSTPFADLRTAFADVRGPLAVRYLVNAGRLDPSSWYLRAETEGSRFTGEGGHFVDTVSALVGADPVEVRATGHGADVHAVLSYPDGSIADLAYLTGGSPKFPKETLDVAAGGTSARLDNFRRVTVWPARGRVRSRGGSRADKGQRGELAAFVAALRTGGPMPIPFGSLVATTRATLAVGTSTVTRAPVALDGGGGR